jgi:hypothetical protein
MAATKQRLSNSAKLQKTNWLESLQPKCAFFVKLIIPYSGRREWPQSAYNPAIRGGLHSRDKPRQTRRVLASKYLPLSSSTVRAWTTVRHWRLNGCEQSVRHPQRVAALVGIDAQLK